MPSVGHFPNPLDGNHDHDWCLATRLCKRCGAGMADVAAGRRADHCEPGVTGISWQRRAERMRDLMGPEALPSAYDGALRGDNFRVVGFAENDAEPGQIVRVPLLGSIGERPPLPHINCRCILPDDDGPGVA